LTFSSQLFFSADKQTFPQLDVIGWYATGSALGPLEMDIQRKASQNIGRKFSEKKFARHFFTMVN
jgi:hypothetical protein